MQRLSDDGFSRKTNRKIPVDFPRKFPRDRFWKVKWPESVECLLASAGGSLRLSETIKYLIMNNLHNGLHSECTKSLVAAQVGVDQRITPDGHSSEWSPRSGRREDRCAWTWHDELVRRIQLGSHHARPNTEGCREEKC